MPKTQLQSPILIIHRKVISLADLESTYGLIEGNPNHGEMTLDQFMHMRPIPGYSRYRTPVKGLYLCSAGSHPGGGVTGIPGSNAAREILDECLSKSGAEFYGASWCPFCAKQMRYFGEYADLLPYIECSEPGTRKTLPQCDGILGFPTWKFANRIPWEGVLTPEVLAEATGCPLSSTDEKTVAPSETPKE